MGKLLNFKRCVYLLPVLLIQISAVNLYHEYYLENDRLCALQSHNTRQIDIGKDEKSGAIVEETSYFDSLSGLYSFNCHFRVKATASDMGIFAVIQKMRLRKKSNGECLDYVQFRYNSGLQFGPLTLDLENKEVPWGEKHCGNVNAMELDFNSLDPTDMSQMLPYAYIEKKGKIDVRIHIANDTVTKGTLDLKIAFTSFYVCRSDLGGLYKKCGGDACIWHKYFNDGILNCPFTTCADENGCHVYAGAGGIRPSAGLATKVMVGAVAGVFTMFIVFVLFLWLFRHCSLCWNDTIPNAQNTTQMRPVPTMEDVQPTAPPITPPMDKDLPPSYESLFPNA